MCGISGIVGAGDWRTDVGAMLGRMHHRGPDGGGVWQEDGACLGMRRLSIIDLAGGDQPMLSDDGQVALVFNGEIYNYLELRASLAARGHQFRRMSDTEALLHAYLEYGTDCVDHLRGMFAFAVWDRSRQQLFVARDRLGKKPLYYGWRGSDFIFTSELKTLVPLRDLRLSVDPIAVEQYFTVRYVPAPRTIFREVQKLLPGCTLTLRPGAREQTRRYWRVPFGVRTGAHDPGAGEALERLRAGLSESVALRMRSDVPVGLLLSGGLDSSVIAALMVRHTSRRVQTFSVGFPGGGGLDESASARRVAAYLGTDHHELMVEGRATDLLPTVVYHLDEPLADAAALPTLQIAMVARRHVKVALSGEGADELFGGYRYLRQLYGLAWTEGLPAVVRDAAALAGGPLGRVPPRATTARLARVLRGLPLDLEGRYRRVASVFDAAERARLLGPAVQEALGRDPVGGAVALPSRGDIPGALDWLLAALTETWLPDDLLMKVDKMTMAASIEARTPFLDHRLVEEMAALPDRYKLSGRGNKVLLRRLARELLPAELVARPKHGFDVPLDAWFRGELRPLLHDALTGKDAEEMGLVNGAEARRLAETHQSGRGNHGQQLWTILCFHLWLQGFRQSAVALPDAVPALHEAR